jgi:hypothetical protein
LENEKYTPLPSSLHAPPAPKAVSFAEAAALNDPMSFAGLESPSFGAYQKYLQERQMCWQHEQRKLADRLAWVKATLPSLVHPASCLGSFDHSHQSSLGKIPQHPPGIFEQSDTQHSDRKSSRPSGSSRADGISELRIERDSYEHIKVHWCIDARRLRSKSALLVSPGFDIFPESCFKLIVKPKGHAGFHKSGGCGSLALTSRCA